ncbi:MAG: DNA-binding protein [Gammaproteobacteria bacterium RBG_16_51_14]|nr:MAG: DNA-binding protein [Gammaproteobacteria bacterium RBG_16_51_14]
MSLENLLKIGQLKEHQTDAADVQRLLAAAQRNLTDARVTSISPETRFDAAYKAIMQAALTALMAQGYRPDTNRPGHHMTIVQALPLTIGLAEKRMAVLDTLRRKRNIADYTGEDIDDVSMENCVDEAEQLIADVNVWLKTNRPHLLVVKK